MIGIPDQRLGEIVCAALKMSNNKMLDEKEIQEFCKGKVNISHIILNNFPVNNYLKNSTDVSLQNT